MHVARAEDCVLREGQREQLEPLRGRRRRLDTDLETVLREDVEMIDDEELVRRSQVERQRRDEPLRVQRSRALQAFEWV